jgi:hypothetical protein
MKAILFVLAAGLLLFCGCSTTHTVQRAAAPAWGPEAVDQLSGKDVTVTHLSGKTTEGEFVTMDTAQVVLLAFPGERRMGVSLDSIYRIESGSNFGWTVLGVLGGTVAGAAIGSAIGMATASDEDVFLFSTLAHGVGGMAVGSLFGGIAGGVTVGLLTKSHHYTIFQSAVSPQALGTEKK